MSNLRTLKGLVNSLADTFVSRNNDVFGYWGMGLLYREANESCSNEVVIELLSGRIDGETAVSAELSARYQVKLARWCESRNVNLAGAKVTAKFGLPSSSRSRDWNDFGEPFIVTFHLTDSSGKTAVASREGWCRVHDPRLENRSTRWRDT